MGRSSTGSCKRAGKDAGRRKGRYYIRGTMAGIIETNATSGSQARGLAIEGIPVVPSIVSLFDGFCEAEVGVDGPCVLAARAFRGSNFADAFAPRASFLPSCFYGLQLPCNARRASERQSAGETSVHVLNVACIKNYNSKHMY